AQRHLRPAAVVGVKDEGAAVVLPSAHHLEIDEKGVVLRPGAAGLPDPGVAELYECVLTTRPHHRVGRVRFGSLNFFTALIAVQLLGRSTRLGLRSRAGTGYRRLAVLRPRFDGAGEGGERDDRAKDRTRTAPRAADQAGHASTLQ